jgi:hypothetical protein
MARTLEEQPGGLAHFPPGPAMNIARPMLFSVVKTERHLRLDAASARKEISEPEPDPIGRQAAAAMAATNKCLARSNKSRHVSYATNAHNRLRYHVGGSIGTD